MRPNYNLLKQKVSSLEEKVKEKNKLIKKYKKALTDSNARIASIAKDLSNSVSVIRDINKNLIPVHLPQISGFEFSYKFLPAKKGVSGDFFDIIPIKDSMKFGIIFSTCNTYSLTSLFLSSFLKSASDIHKHKTAKDFISFITKKIKANSHNKEKIHLFYGIISRSSFEMDYCLVGDIFIGHKRADKKLNILSPSADNLLKSKIDFKSRKIILEPKDNLLICSPGVRYRTNKKGDYFGVKNIIKSTEKNPSAEALEIRQNILFACNEFGKNNSNKNDCSVLALKVMDKVVKLQN